jgi:hypothetical protein
MVIHISSKYCLRKSVTTRPRSVGKRGFLRPVFSDSVRVFMDHFSTTGRGKHACLPYPFLHIASFKMVEMVGA